MPRKTDKLTIRIAPTVKDALREASEHDNRSVANLIEVLVLTHCKKIGIKVKEDKSRKGGTDALQR